MRKTPAEVAALREAGEAIDRVHANVPNWLRAGQTERQVGAKIAEAIFAEGHVSADFVIVGSGPNAASPHHEVSDRVMAAATSSWSTSAARCRPATAPTAPARTPSGSAPDDFTAYYEVLKRAQEAATVSVRPGVTAESVDRAARDIIATPGTASGSSTAPATGSAWRPTRSRTSSRATPPAGGRHGLLDRAGIYPGPHGARIEDIVVCTETGFQRLNNGTRELVIV